MILFLTDSSPDYGADFLYDGFARVFGPESVIDYPSKPSLHGVPAGFDCDLDWPCVRDSMSAEDRLDLGSFELVVMPTLRGDVPAYVHSLAARGLLDKVRDRTVCYDAEDHTANTRQHYVDALGYEPVVYFKRELPLGATWATPLPFGYPEERMVNPLADPRQGVAFNAYLWEWARGGLREQIGLKLSRGEFRGHITLTSSPEGRVSVADNHRHNRASLCAISPAGQGNGTNRDLEVISDGCAPIWQTRTVEYPNAPHAGTECLYFTSADEALTHVRTLLGDPAYAIGMAQAAQAKLRSHHTTAVRARTVYEAVHGHLR